MTDTPALGIEVTVLRVFTDAVGDFGNPLGVVDAAAVPVARRQALATHLGYSETAFVDLPATGATTARAWIFTPTTELSFAGHPTVGAAWWLRERGTPVETLQVPAGDLQIRYSDDRTAVVARPEWGPEFVIHALTSVDQVLVPTRPTTPARPTTTCGPGSTGIAGTFGRGCSPTNRAFLKMRPPVLLRFASPDTCAAT